MLMALLAAVWKMAYKETGVGMGRPVIIETTTEMQGRDDGGWGGGGRR